MGALVRSQEHWGLEMPSSLDRDGVVHPSGYCGHACELHWRRRFSKWTDACGLYHPRVAITSFYWHPCKSANLRGQSADVLSLCELSFRNKGQISHAENGKNLVSARFVPLGCSAVKFSWLRSGSDVWPDVSLPQPTFVYFVSSSQLELVEYILPNKQSPWNQKLIERKWPVIVCSSFGMSCKRCTVCAQAGLVVGLATLPASLEAHNVTLCSVFGLCA